MSQNNDTTTDESTSNNDVTIAVIAAEEFGKNMPKNERAREIVETIGDAIEENDWEEPDNLVYTPDLVGYGNGVSVALNAYNQMKRDNGGEEEMFNLHAIEARWNATDGRPDDELADRDDGTQYWTKAARQRDKEMLEVSDALVVLGDDGLTGNMIGKFRRAGLDVHQNHVIDEEEAFDGVGF